MSWLWIIPGVAGLVGLAVLAYWQLVVAEGAYLGPRVVAWTYNWVAPRYDSIKRFDPRDESWFVARPLLRRLADVERPLILDVATGTGRLPLALLRDDFFTAIGGRIVGLDLSRAMLRQAWRKLQPYGHQVSLIWQDAGHLPFEDGTFDAVTCLESLEFLPRPLEALGEMVRVLVPGGVLLLTNRVGGEARLLPGKAFPRPQFEQVLAAHPLRDVQVRPWQVQYDLAMAHKAMAHGAMAHGAMAHGAVAHGAVAHKAMAHGAMAHKAMAQGAAAHKEASSGSGGRGDADGSPQPGLSGQGLVEMLPALLRCPCCGGGLQPAPASLSCSACGQSYPIQEGVVLLANSRRRGKP